jgi:hypothetical protein
MLFRVNNLYEKKSIKKIAFCFNAACLLCRFFLPKAQKFKMAAESKMAAKTYLKFPKNSTRH